MKYPTTLLIFFGKNSIESHLVYISCRAKIYNFMVIFKWALKVKKNIFSVWETCLILTLWSYDAKSIGKKGTEAILYLYCFFFQWPFLADLSIFVSIFNIKSHHLNHFFHGCKQFSGHLHVKRQRKKLVLLRFLHFGRWGPGLVDTHLLYSSTLWSWNGSWGLRVFLQVNSVYKFNYKTSFQHLSESCIIALPFSQLK